MAYERAEKTITRSRVLRSQAAELAEGCEGARFFYANVPIPQADVPALRINEGERVVLLGAPGSGKSTLLRLLSGLYRPSAGRMTMGGIDMTLLPSGTRRLAVPWPG